MGSLSSFLRILIILFSSPPTSSSSSSQPTQQIQSPRLLDLLLRDHIFNLSTITNIRTGIPQSITLPAKFSGAAATALRLRCGSLQRYGARIGEYRLPPGVSAQPCVERVLLVRQSLGPNWFQLYRDQYNLSRYRLISPILGILAYNAGDDRTQNNPFELGILSAENAPIKVDFRKLVNSSNTSSAEPHCATFDTSEGRMAVAVAKMVEPFVCAAKNQGHFALVIVDVSPPPRTPQASSRSPPKSETATPTEVVKGGGEEEEGGKASRWKVAVGSSIGAALGAFLLGLLLIAMFVRAKQRTKMEEMARRAYEEEALQVSMVGHVRAPVAPASRTGPTAADYRYRPPYP